MSMTLWSTLLTAFAGAGPLESEQPPLPPQIVSSNHSNGGPGSSEVVFSDPHGRFPVESGHYPVTEIPYADQLYPYDTSLPWMHGYFQEIPAYGGFHFFRPYNYRHVLSQTQAAGGWGMPPTMAYSHTYWRRYHLIAVSPPPPLGRLPLRQIAPSPSGIHQPPALPTP